MIFWMSTAGLALLASVGGSLPRMAHAAPFRQSSAIHLTVDVGYQGRFRDRQWVPLRVTVSNDGPDISGELRVKPNGTFNLTSNTYTAPIDLPTHANKQLFLYAILDVYTQNVQVDLTTSDGIQLQTTTMPVSHAIDSDLLYAVVTESPVGSVDLSSAHSNGTAFQADWQIENIPSLAQALAGLDGLLLTDADTGKLSTDQRTALQNWVLSGGHLIVTGGPNWQKTRAGVDTLLPIAAGSTVTLNTLSALATFAGQPADSITGTVILAQGQPRAGSQVLATQDGTPLLIRGTFGQGVVDYLAADPGLEPFRSWNNRASLWNVLLRSTNHKPGWANGIVDAQSANRAANYILGLRLPDVLQLAGFLGVYILLIGPLNYLVLRRLKRVEWAWFTIPVIILIASAITYVTGFSLRGTQATLNRLSLIQVWPESDQAQVNGVIGVLSPRRATYALSMNDALTVHSLTTSAANALNSNPADVKVGESLHYSVSNIPVDAGISTAFVTDGYIPAPALSGSATLTLGADGKASIKGEVRNNSALTLTDALVLVMQTPVSIGTLAAGETRSFQSDVQPLNIAEPASSSRTPIYNPYTNGYNYSSNQRLQTLQDLLKTNIYSKLQSGNPQEQQTYRRRDYFVGGFTNTSDQFTGRGFDVYLIGWNDQSPLSMTLDAPYITEDTSLYAVKLTTTLATPDATVKVLPSYMQWVTLPKLNQPDFSPYELYLTQGQDATFQFKPIPALRLSTVSTLKIQTSSNNADAGRVSLWDWTTNRYVEFNRPGNSLGYELTLTSPSDLQRYLNSDNTVQIRIQAYNGATSLSSITVSVDGKLAS